MALERLVARCTNLQSLRLSSAVSLETLSRVVLRAPQLRDLGTGSYVHDPRSEPYLKLASAFMACKSLRSLSGFWEVTPQCLPAVYPICSNLTTLNLSYAASIQGTDLIKMIRHSRKLQSLWVSEMQIPYSSPSPGLDWIGLISLHSSLFSFFFLSRCWI